MPKGDRNARPVYSSDEGSLCPSCERALGDCTCPADATALPSGERIRVGFEAKGRRGKAVTLVSGLPLGENELKALAKELKKSCGTGGAVKDGVIEIQGDHREKIQAELAGRGFESKRSGG